MLNFARRVWKKVLIDIKPSKQRIRIGLRAWSMGSLGRDLRLGGKDVVFNNSENIYIGDYVYIGSSCYFDAYSQIRIGDGCMIGPRVFVVSGSHNYDSKDLMSVPYDRRQVDLPIIIDDNVWIAGNVSIAPGTRIGEGSVVAMGCTVSGEIPPYSVVMGPKAAVVKQRDAERYRRLAADGMVYGKVFAGSGFELARKEDLAR
ncbi:acyltransferase [Adlercreutzia caecimuris]|uniref:acyltransferase n=1 Tax=Adlercreutzia caecimuris TaxID=671266 RepID=UPI002590532B|nr:acyltransferase [Adlercreutzia caecimuris]